MQCRKQRIPLMTAETKATLLLSGLLVWLGLGAFVMGQLEVKPARIILQHEGCMLVERAGVHIKSSADGTTCEGVLPFRRNLFSTGGRADIGEDSFTLSEHQIIGYYILPDQPYTPYQWKLIFLLAGASALLLLLAFSNKLFTRKG